MIIIFFSLPHSRSYSRPFVSRALVDSSFFAGTRARRKRIRLPPATESSLRRRAQTTVPACAKVQPSRSAGREGSVQPSPIIPRWSRPRSRIETKKRQHCVNDVERRKPRPNAAQPRKTPPFEAAPPFRCRISPLPAPQICAASAAGRPQRDGSTTASTAATLLPRRTHFSLSSPAPASDSSDGGCVK